MTDDIKALEKSFCGTFLDKRVSERVMFELGSEKKRSEANKRFCHNAASVLKQDKISRSGCFAENEVIDFLKGITGCKDWLLIGYDASVICGLERAVEKGFAGGMGFAAVSADMKAAAVREEQSFGAPTAYILKN